MHGSRSMGSIFARRPEAHSRLLRDRRAQHLPDLPALRAAARTLERRSSTPRRSLAFGNCCRSPPRLTSKNLRPRGPAIEARQYRGGRHRRSRPRRPRYCAARRQGRLHRRSITRGAGAFSRAQAAAASRRGGARRGARAIARSGHTALRAFWRVRRMFAAAFGTRCPARSQGAPTARQPASVSAACGPSGCCPPCGGRSGPIGGAPGSASNTSTRRAGCSRAFANDRAPTSRTFVAARSWKGGSPTCRHDSPPWSRRSVFVTRCRRSNWRPAMSARPWSFASGGAEPG